MNLNIVKRLKATEDYMKDWDIHFRWKLCIVRLISNASIMLEKFPVCGLVEIKGKTAKDFYEEEGLSLIHI